jgi:hypothetical protein
MKVLTPILVFFGRLFSFSYMGSGLYKRWSYVYRWLYERKYKDVQLATFDTLPRLATWVNRQKWKADSWKEMWDAISTPQKVQAIGQDKDGDHFIGDCDEFAIYSVAAIQGSLAAGLMKGENIAAAYILSVTWFNPTKMKTLFGFGGHNVCLIEFSDMGPKYAYMDYYLPSKRAGSIADIAEVVRQRYSGEGVIPLVWHVAKLDLTPVQTRWG